MDHKSFKPSPRSMSATESLNSHRTRRRKAHSFSSSLLESICQSMDQDDHHSSRRSQNIDDVQSNKIGSSHINLKLNHHHQHHIKVGKQSRIKDSAQAETVANVEKIVHRAVNVPSFSSSSIVSNFSYSDSSSTHGRLSSSVSSYGTGSADSSSSSSCFSTCSSKTPTSSIKEKITKAKVRAIKLYTELKNSKKTKPVSPPSPRCRLTTYLNSIFTPKKQNKTEHSIVTPPEKNYKKPITTSITKPTPPPPPATESRRPMFIDRKASVSPAMTIIRHDQQDEVKGREIFKKCKEKIVRGLKMREFVEEFSGDGDDGDCDTESYASSDLFELEFLMERGGEELPVFETTDIKINQAISNRYSM